MVVALGVSRGNRIRLTGPKAQTDCPGLLRRIVVWDADNEREIVLLTNLLVFGSTTIAAIFLPTLPLQFRGLWLRFRRATSRN